MNYIREGKSVCRVCAREVDTLFPVVVKAFGEGLRSEVVARHLNRIEGFTSKGASPTGFCPGSLQRPVAR